MLRDRSPTVESASPTGKLLYAVSSLVVVRSATAMGIVPPRCAAWIPPSIGYTLCAEGNAQLFSVSIPARSVSGMPITEHVHDVGRLLHELILEASRIRGRPERSARDERLVHFLLDEMRDLAVTPLCLRLPRHERLLSMYTSLIAAPGQNTSLAEWSERLGMKAGKLQQHFVVETGQTFDAWRRQARLLMAVRRLARGDRVFEIVTECGYRAHSSFAASFMRLFGEQPTKFQESCRRPLEL